MEFIGQLIKETTRIRYRRTQKKENNKGTEEQLRTLNSLLQSAKMTDFGIIHHFHDILEGATLEVGFRQQVPLTDYDTFFQQWLQRCLDGQEDVIWSGKIQYYAKSSGTSGFTSKRIPVSHAMIKQFRRTSLQQIADLHQLDLAPGFYQSKFLILGGSTELSKYGPTLWEGDLSGILAHHKSAVLAPFSKPGRKISKIQDWEEKIDRIVEKAANWNIGVISGIPSWVLLLLERIVKHYQVDDIHAIWPNLQMYVHGGVFVEPYRQKLDKLFGSSVLYQNTFLASEGYFAYQRDYQNKELELLTEAGVYYEFIEEVYFDQLRNKDYYKIPSLTLKETKPGKHYALVISTCSGLWRYVLGDVIEFSALNHKNIRIVGRISHSLNMCGEHLSEVNMVKAIEETARTLRISVEEFCVYPSKDFERHNWYIGTNEFVNSNQFSAILDERLAKYNDDYANVRRHLLKMPKIKVLPVERFYGFLLLRKSYGAQGKFPRVMQPHIALDWERFLTREDQFQELYVQNVS